MLITVAGGDTEVRRIQNVEMHEAMKAAGAEVEFEWLVDRTHNSILPNMIKPGGRTVELLLDFLRRHGMAPWTSRVPERQRLFTHVGKRAAFLPACNGFLPVTPTPAG
jgi:phosphoribosylformylglycinamidine (FGAM) synthase-like amidotransferase family enzyme